MLSSVGSFLIILIVNLALLMACVASPTTFARSDRLNRNIANQQPEVVTSVSHGPVSNEPVANEPVPAPSTGAISPSPETPATVPVETPPAAPSTPPPVVVAAVDEPTGTVEPTDGGSSVESGTGVNNGAGPTGTIFDCKGEGTTLKLQGTAIPTYISGALVRQGQSHAIGCSTNFQDGIWSCQDFDSDLRIKISKSGSVDHQAVITDKDSGGNEVTLGTMTCPAK